VGKKGKMRTPFPHVGYVESVEGRGEEEENPITITMAMAMEKRGKNIL
jgi:hypothetical protein